MVVRHIGIEIGPRAFNGDLPEQARVGELMQRVVDRRQRDRNIRRHRFFMKPFGGNMTMPAAKQNRRKGNPLTRRPQACGAQIGSKPYLRAGIGEGNG